MTGPASRCLLVGLEDQAPAGVVAAAAAHIATAQDATALIVLHVLDTHMVAGGLLGLSGLMGSMGETGEDQERMLAAAVIAQVAKEVGAVAIVVGARRPHALRRLVHPDVRASRAGCTTVPVHVAPLQAQTPG